MNLQTILNEFELDWCQAPLRKKGFPFHTFQDKIFVVVGNSGVTEAFIYSLLSAMESQTIHIKLYWCPLVAENEYCFKKELLLLENLHICTLADISSADYIIYTGLCGQKISPEAEVMAHTVKQAHTVFKKAIELKPDCLLLLSDYRAVSREHTSLYISEYEHSLDSFTTPSALPRITMQLLESLCRDYSKQYNISCNILRVPIVFGACMRQENHFLNCLASHVANGQEITLTHTHESYSYIYISDMLTAIWHILAICPRNTVFHASGLDTPVTPEEIFAILYKNFSELTDIQFGEETSLPDYGLALNDEKLRLYGWTPEVSFEDGLIMLIKSIQNPNQIFIFNQIYQGKLDIIHEILLAHLLEIDRICKKYNIKYFLAGGTLLGAIRHHGFIPWDDDADVMMLREDFERFSKIVQKELPDNLFFQSNKSEELNHAVFRKIRINNTVFATKHTAKFPAMHNGIFVDVISHDATADHRIAQKLHIFATRGIRALVFNKWAHSSVREEKHSKIGVLILNGLKELLPMSFLETIQEKLLTLFSRKKHPHYLYDSMGRNINRGAFPASWLDEVIEVEFEGHMLPIPKEYDKYLTWLYGDYMQMIPVSKRRISHSILWMDLGEYEYFQIDNSFSTKNN